VLADVASYGWHIIHVSADADGPGWSYSIGLYRTFTHPEFLVFGLPADRAQHIINDLGTRIKAGARYVDGASDSDVLASYSVRFVLVPRAAYRAHFGIGVWFYRSESFPVLQVVWPDRAAVFPWEAGFDPTLTSVQPVLGTAT
jgi:hypothetical protein